MALEFIDLIVAIFSFIYVLANITISIKIIWKYNTFKSINILLMGIAWIGLAFPWIPDVLNPLYEIIDPGHNNNGIIVLNYIVNVVIISIPIICWIIAILNLLSVRKSFKYTILISVILIILIFETILLLLFTTDLISGAIHVYNYTSDILDVFLLVVLVIILVSGMIFAGVSIKSSNKVVKIKGIFLIIAFTLFPIGALIDMVISGITSNIVARLILCISSIIFYFGLIMPTWVKKKLIKEE